MNLHAYNQHQTVCPAGCGTPVRWVTAEDAHRNNWAWMPEWFQSYIEWDDVYERPAAPIRVHNVEECIRWQKEEATLDCAYAPRS